MESTRRTFNLSKVTDRMHYVNATWMIVDYQGGVYIIQRFITAKPPKLDEAKRAIALCGMTAMQEPWKLIDGLWALRLKERNREKGNYTVLVDNGKPPTGAAFSPV